MFEISYTRPHFAIAKYLISKWGNDENWYHVRNLKQRTEQFHISGLKNWLYSMILSSFFEYLIFVIWNYSFISKAHNLIAGKISSPRGVQSLYCLY